MPQEHTLEHIHAAFPWLTRAKVRILWEAMHGGFALPEDDDRYRQNYNPPDEHQRRMDLVNDVLGGYGVEGGAAFEYVNMGDTYDMTVVYDNEEDEWHLMSYGDYVEALEGNAAEDAECNEPDQDTGCEDEDVD